MNSFWIGLAIFYAADAWLHNQGFNTFFFNYKTPVELEAQRVKLGLEPDCSKEES